MTLRGCEGWVRAPVYLTLAVKLKQYSQEFLVCNLKVFKYLNVKFEKARERSIVALLDSSQKFRVDFLFPLEQQQQQGLDQSRAVIKVSVAETCPFIRGLRPKSL